MSPPPNPDDEHVRIPLKDILSLHARRFSPKKNPRLRIANLETISDTYHISGSVIIEKLKKQEFRLISNDTDETGTTTDNIG